MIKNQCAGECIQQGSLYYKLDFSQELLPSSPIDLGIQ